MVAGNELVGDVYLVAAVAADHASAIFEGEEVCLDYLALFDDKLVVLIFGAGV